MQVQSYRELGRSSTAFSELASKVSITCHFLCIRSKSQRPAHKASPFLKFIFYWNIVCLQCCVNFWCTYMCIYTWITLFSFLLWCITGYWIQFPVLNSRTLLCIHSLYNGLPLLISHSQSSPPPPPLPLATTSLVVCWVCWVCSCFINKFICITV